MVCVKCGSNNVKAFVKLGLTMDADDVRAVTKKVLAKGSTQLLYKYDEDTSFICSDCGHTMPSLNMTKALKEHEESKIAKRCTGNEKYDME